MEKIKVDFLNCFGIQEMHHEFEFHGDNVITVYSRNGLMKTSFAKTFQKIQTNKADDVCDAIFGDVESTTVKIDGRDMMRCSTAIRSFPSGLSIYHTYSRSLKSICLKNTIFNYYS